VTASGAASIASFVKPNRDKELARIIAPSADGKNL